MKKRIRKKIYSRYIDDIAVDISTDRKFRRALSGSPFEEKLEISRFTAWHCVYLRPILKKNLTFYVEKVQSCPIAFDDDLTVFKFTAKGFPGLVRYSGNNISDRNLLKPE